MTAAAYDSNNIFAQILRGEIPCHKVFEDNDTIAIMDIMPQTTGHTLVVPKARFRNILDADPVVLSRIIPVVQTIAQAAMTAFKADGCQILQLNEAAAGQTIYHLHFHVLPLKQGETVRLHAREPEDKAVIAAHANMMRAVLTGL